MLPEYDGVAEVWFESKEALVTEMGSPEGEQLAAALLEDERNFIDRSKSAAFIVEEHELEKVLTWRRKRIALRGPTGRRDAVRTKSGFIGNERRSS